MPHDINGNLLKVGDCVSCQFTVKAITTDEEYCNVTLETVEPMFPGEYKSTFTANAKQVALIPVAVST